MEFQILDLDYVSVGERPVLRIFGKDPKGATVCAFYKGFKPYFYADGKDVPKLLEKNNEVEKIEEVDRNKVGCFHTVKMYKVTTINPARTPELRDYLISKGCTLYEADVLFKYRFMNDMGLSGLGWVKMDEGTRTATNTVKTKEKFEVKSMSAVDRMGDAPLKIMAFDIECVAEEAGVMPEAHKDPVIMISCVFSAPYKGKRAIVLSTRGGKGVQTSDDEKGMLEDFMGVVNDFDPDIMTGYNCNGFDFPYILERMKKNRIRPVFGRCEQKAVTAKTFGLRTRVNVVGRIVVDSFALIKKDFSLQRYTLNNVAKVLLKKEKVNVKHSEIEKLWKGTQKEFDKLVEYCKIDSVLAMDLVVEKGLTDKYFALSKVSGALAQDSLDGGETIRIENYLLGKFNRKNYVMPCKPTEEMSRQRTESKKEGFEGGAVLDPIRGLHSSVLVLDFKSMYPSIIRSYNICPTTIVPPGMKEILVDGRKLERNELSTSPSGGEYLPHQVRQGIVPKMLENLMAERGAVKKEMSKAEGELHRQLYAKQWALKIMANATYGYFGYTRSRLFNLQIANSITSIGRSVIHFTKDTVEKKYGYTVVYGDTDSVFVKVDTEDMDKIEKMGTEISKYVTDNILGTQELEFEKVFMRFLPLTKKRYAAWAFAKKGDKWIDWIDTKGIETVRRDWCRLVGTTLQTIIEIILKKNDVKKALGFFKETVDKVLNNEIDPEQLVITKTVTKKPEKYMGVQPHIELMKKMIARNSTDAPGVGDRIGYVIIKGKGLLSKRTEDPEYVKEHGLEIDSQYYIENQLLPPIERIFGALGITKSEMLGNGKQIGILDAIRGAARNQAQAPEPQEPVEIPAELVNGFICTKCNKHYPRMPLSGACGCGGALHFSSPKGSAAEVKLN